MKIVEQDCGVAGVWSSPVIAGARGVSVSISGTFSATVTVQRSFDSGSSWKDLATYTGVTELHIDSIPGLWYRVGVGAGDYTSGTAEVALAVE